MKHHPLPLAIGLAVAGGILLALPLATRHPRATRPSIAAPGPAAVAATGGAEASAPAGKPEIDLTHSNRTMAYSLLIDILLDPLAYRGRTIRMAGLYATAAPEGEAKRRHACFISDAGACCAQGLEFAPLGRLVHPDDFPPPGSRIQVEGILDTYEEDGRPYAYVRDAVITHPSTR